MENYFNYFTEIEEYFIRRRGKNLFVSPLDWCLIELWRDNGIPLNVALRGIDRGFEALASRGRRPPRSLFYCHPAVLDAFEEHQQALLGTSAEDAEPSEAPDDQAVPRQQVEQALQRLLEAVQSQSGEPFERAARRLSALIEDLGQAREVGFERVDKELAQIGATLTEDLIGEMGSDEVAELRKEVRQETRLYTKRLGKEMMKRLQANYLQRKLLQSRQLPDFSLFSFSGS